LPPPGAFLGKLPYWSLPPLSIVWRLFTGAVPLQPPAGYPLFVPT